MPAAQDLNRPSAACTNPFEELPNHINEYTANEIEALQCRLNKQLGPEYISTRPGAGGGKVHYLAAEKVINLANEVFGFNGWSSQIQKVEIDFVDEREGGRITLGLAIIVRVTLRDGTFHEDMGYGHIENCKGKAAAFEKARKEAATDGLKRALRNFGKVLGNCLYDKDYLSRVTKVKMQPSRWDEANLHRHPDFAPVKKEAPRNTSDAAAASNLPAPVPHASLRHSGSADCEDDFGGGALFDGVEMSPVEAAAAPENEIPQGQQPDVLQTGVSVREQYPAPQMRPPGPQRHTSMPVTVPARTMPPPNAPSRQPHHHQPQPQPQLQQSTTYSTPPNNTNIPQPPQSLHNDPESSTESANATANATTPSGFVSSRAVIRKDRVPNDEPLSEESLARCPPFDPNAESPSIPKTSGIDHSTSAKIKSAVVGSHRLPLPNSANGTSPAPVPQPPVGSGPRNFVNPHMDTSRRISMAGSHGTGSPLSNRATFKHPGPATAGVKRSLPVDGPMSPVTRSRTPLGDVSNTNGANGTTSALSKENTEVADIKPGPDIKADVANGVSSRVDEASKRAKFVA